MAMQARSVAYKSITSIPGWLETYQSAPARLTSTGAAYLFVPLIYRAVNLRCDALASVPVKLYRYQNGKRGDEVDWPWPGVDATDLIWRTEAARLLTGAAYWLKNQNRVKVVGLTWLNPTTMGVDARIATHEENGRRTIERVVTFHQSADIAQQYTADEVVYFREFNLLDDILPGPGAAEVAFSNSKLLYSMAEYAGKFFEGGAMPALLLGLPATTSEAERERTESKFRQWMTGMKNAFRVLAIRAGLIDPKIISFPIKDLAMPELEKQARQSVADAFGIPLTMLSDAANFATASQHDAQFWQTSIRPAGETLQGIANRQLFHGLGLEMTFAFESLDVFQEDEATRAKSILDYMTILEKCPTYPIFEHMVKDSGCEFSEDLLGAVEEWYAGKEQKAAQITEQMAPAPAEPPAQPEPPQEDPLEVDKGKWRKKALKKLTRTGSAACEFESEVIPDELHAAISARLEAATTEDEVRGAFEVDAEPVTSDLATELKRANDLLERAMHE
jgi:HK97 family phage portal protein